MMHQNVRCLIQGCADHLVTATTDAAVIVSLTRTVAFRGEAEIRSNIARSREALGRINARPIGEGHNHADTGNGHQELRKYHRAFAKPRDGVTKACTMIYFARKQDCEACALKPKCCPNVPVRTIGRSIYEAARDKARAISKTEAYAVSRRERKKVGMLFAHLKRILRVDRLRLRGPSGAKDEFLLAPQPKICGNWRRSSPSRRRSSPHEAQRRHFASLTAATQASCARLKTGFFKEIDVKLPLRIATLNASTGRR